MSGSGPIGSAPVVLVGMMGSGKTTVGRLLAARLGREFVDSDVEIERRTGMTVREIWERDGEEAFRSEERRVLADALARDQPLVIAAAGGSVLSSDNRSLMADAGHVVWLRAPVSVLVDRVGSSGHRPLLDDDPQGALDRMEAERSALYEEVAARQVDVAGRTPDEVVDELVGVMT